MSEFFERLAELVREHRTLVLATVVATEGSTPREAGARMAVLPDGSIEGTVGGGILEKRVVDDALALMSEERPRLVRYDLTEEQRGGIGSECGGRSEVFLEPVGSAPHLLVLGAGHVGLALARMASLAGFAVTVVDDRPDLAERAALPGVRIDPRPPADPSVRDLVTSRTAVTVVTRSHRMDRDALAHVADAGAFYVGMIGSQRKVALELSALRERGVPAQALERVHAPIGVDIGARTPGEIAVAVLAEIIAVRRTGETPAASLLRTGKPHRGDPCAG
jgi:xanthine dehydrogenase accessory factor